MVGGHPLVTLITPSLNQGEFIRAAIDSVLAQTYHNIEYRVMDGGSTDSTLQTLYSYGDRIAWRSRADRGQAAAINEGILGSKGDIIGWLNTDDTLLPWTVSAVVQEFDRHPEVDVVYGETIFTDRDGRHLFRSALREFNYEEFVVSCHNPICQPSAFIRRSAWQWLDESLHYFFDWDLWLRAGLHHRFLHVPEMFSTYRLHPGSKSCGKVPAYELRMVYGNYFLYGVPPAILARKAEATANMLREMARYHAANGERLKSWQCRAEAMITDWRVK
jgi:glycosyltransferase involved in cell wall biosynthesis